MKKFISQLSSFGEHDKDEETRIDVKSWLIDALSPQDDYTA